MAKTKPWLDYNGETTAELLACKKTHRIDSILCALEWGIQGKKKHTAEERLVLSIMALDREVHNGGFDQFFRNSSKQHAPIIVNSLETIGSKRTAALAAKAIAALKLDRVTRKALDEAMAKRSPVRDKKLDALDQEYYAFYENEKKLFAYVEKNAAHIECDGIPAPKIDLGEAMPISDLTVELQFDEHSPQDLPSAITRARQLARREKIKATDSEVTAAAHLYLLPKLALDKKWDACDTLVQPLIDLAGNEASVEIRMFVEELTEAKRHVVADRWALAFLELLRTCPEAPSEDSILFWTDFVKEHAGALPKAFALSRKAFARGKR